MAHLVGMYKEIEMLRNEVEIQKRLAEYWEERWKREYSEKIDLLHENIGLKRQCEGILAETLARPQINTFTEVPEKSQRLEISGAQVKALHAKKRGALSDIQRQEQGDPGRPHAKVGRGTSGVRILGSPKEDTPRGASPGDQISCGYCGKINHTEVNCWKRRENCLRCGGANHRVANCPVVRREGKRTQQPIKTNPEHTKGKGIGSTVPTRVNLLEQLQVFDSSEDVEGMIRRLT